MIISASRRTDIPGFYAEWFMNRIREGYCTVPNPFNAKQVSRISLRPRDVDVIVFWTRYAGPMLPYLQELDSRGFRYYFLYTLMNNPRELDPKSPNHQKAIETFRRLSDSVGREKVVWRYDPIVFSSITDSDFHEAAFERLAEALRGYTQRCIISVVDMYRKASARLRILEKSGIHIHEPRAYVFDRLMKTIIKAARENKMALQSCAEEAGVCSGKIPPGKCIDDKLIQDVFGLDVTHRTDPSQRSACGCVASRDIGMYHTCRFGCVYCYATASFERARERYQHHDPTSPSLTGRFEATTSQKKKTSQRSLFE